MRRAVLALLLLSTSAFAQSYEVFAIRYATVPDFAVAGLVQGAESGRKMDIAMMVWLIRGVGTTSSSTPASIARSFSRAGK